MPTVKELFADSNRGIRLARLRITRALKSSKATPIEAQLKFIRGLVEDEMEAQAFTEDPKKYAVEHGVILEPRVVEIVAHTAIFRRSIPKEVTTEWSKTAIDDLVSIVDRNVIAAIPAAALAVAAVVVAAAAVVEAVVTVIRTKSAMDLNSLKGLGPNGIRLPDGTQFKGRIR